MNRSRNRTLSRSLRAAVLMVCAGLCAGPAAPAVAASPTPATGDAPDCARSTQQVVTDQPWPQTRLGLDELHRQYRGFGTKIAVISSGVSADHPQLKGRVLPGESVGVLGAATQDCLGFGTAVAGAAAAAAVSGTPLVGVAPQAVVIPVRLPDWAVNPSSALDAEHAATASTLVGQAVRAALADDPDVIVLPSVALPDTSELRSALDDAEERGCLVLEGATGSSSTDPAGTYPAAYPQVLVVEGVSPDDELAPTDLGADVVDLVAPGVEVPVLTPVTGHQLVTSSAVAAGYAAGAAALVVDAVHPRTAAALRQRMLQSSAHSSAGFLPVLDPAAALTAPEALAAPRGQDTITRLLATSGPSDRAALISATLSTTALVALVVLGITAAAVARGRRRGWQPAGHHHEPPGPERPADTRTGGAGSPGSPRTGHLSHDGGTP